jgi:ABC-2 type transport system ATP-binding protein
LLAPTSGEVIILGRTWQKDSRELREWLGISLQETRLSEKLSVRETIELFASFYSEPRSSDEVLRELQLEEKADAWVGKLSGGQQSWKERRWERNRDGCWYWHCGEGFRLCWR